MLTIRRDLGIVSQLLGLWMSVLACRSAPAVEPPVTGQTTQPVAATPAPAARSEIGFRSGPILARHFEKHGSEFEGYTKADYLAAAQRLRDAVVGGDILELKRPDGTFSRFDRRSRAFVAFDPDGTIRTFFRPNDGEAYFRRQARRSQQ